MIRNKRKVKRRKVKRKSEFNAITWYLGLFAIVIELFIGFRYINSIDAFDQTFGYIAVLEGFFALIGILFIDLINGHGFRIKPKTNEFRDIPPFKTFQNSVYVLIVIFSIQFATVFIPFTVSNIEIGLAIIFASVCEEIFFRGLLLSIVKRGTKEIKTKRYKVGMLLSISLLEMVGVLISAFLFALIHINYYENPSVLIGVFLGGLALSLAYFMTDDLTPLIFAHLFLNIYAVYQVLGLSIFLVNV